MRIHAKLLDGLSPIPFDIFAEKVDSSLHCFHQDQLLETVSLNRVEQVKLGSEYQISFSAGDDSGRKLVLLHSNEEFFRIIEQENRFSVPLTPHWWKKAPLPLLLLVVLILMCGFYWVYTSGIRKLHHLVSIEQEAALGEVVYKRFAQKYSPYTNETQIAELEALLFELIGENSDYDYRLSVFESSKSEGNAFALPGGRVMVMSGLLDYFDSIEDIAGVLAHEIAHVEKRHGIKHILNSLGSIVFVRLAVGGGFEELEAAEGIVELSGLFLIFQHSRDAEREADTLAIERLHQHNRSVEGLIHFFKQLQEQESLFMSKLSWVSTHPVNEERIKFFENHLDVKPVVE